MSQRPIQKLSGNALVYGIGSAIGRLASFIFLPIFTAYLTPSDYGVAGLLAWLGFLATPVCSLGMGAALAPVYFLSKDSNHRAQAMWTASTISALGSLPLVAGASIFPRTVATWLFHNPAFGDLVSLSLLGVAASIVSGQLLQRLQFEQRPWPYVMVTFGSSLVGLATSLVLVVVLGRGLRGYVEGQTTGQILGMTTLLVWTLRDVRIAIALPMAGKLLRLGLPLIPSFAFLFLLQHANRWVLERYSGIAQVGIYSIGYSLGMVMNVAVGAFQSAWAPFFLTYRERQDEASVLFGRIVKYYVIAFGAAVLAAFVLARPVVALMTTAPFHGAWKVVGPVALAQFFMGLFYALLPPLYFSDNVPTTSLVLGLASMLGIALSLGLIPALGAVGAAWALVGGIAVLAALTWGWSKVHPSWFRIRFEVGRMMQFAGCAFVIGGLLSLRDIVRIRVELIISPLALLATAGLVCWSLDSRERSAVLATIRGLVPRKAEESLENTR